MNTETDIPAEQTFEAKVNDLVGKLTKDENDKWTLPEEVDEPTRFAVMAERRRRDTQASFTQAQQKLKAFETENNILADMLEKELASVITDEQKDELDDLKHTDPEKWRVRLNELEVDRKNQLATKRQQVREQVEKESELERRTRLLAEFNETNPEIQLTDDVIEEELPPKFAKQLERGEITFEQFLDNARTFLSKGKTIAPVETPPASPTLAKVGGSHKPSEQARTVDSTESYRRETY